MATAGTEVTTPKIPREYERGSSTMKFGRKLNGVVGPTERKDDATMVMADSLARVQHEKCRLAAAFSPERFGARISATGRASRALHETRFSGNHLCGAPLLEVNAACPGFPRTHAFSRPPASLQGASSGRLATSWSTSSTLARTRASTSKGPPAPQPALRSHVPAPPQATQDRKTGPRSDFSGVGDAQVATSGSDAF